MNITKSELPATLNYTYAELSEKFLHILDSLNTHDLAQFNLMLVRQDSILEEEITKDVDGREVSKKVSSRIKYEAEVLSFKRNYLYEQYTLNRLNLFLEAISYLLKQEPAVQSYAGLIYELLENLIKRMQENNITNTPIRAVDMMEQIKRKYVLPHGYAAEA